LQSRPAHQPPAGHASPKADLMMRCRIIERPGVCGPKTIRLISLSADALVKLGRRDEALEATRQALKVADAHLELNPDDARALPDVNALWTADRCWQILGLTRRAGRHSQLIAAPWRRGCNGFVVFAIIKATEVLHSRDVENPRAHIS
jgi:hypothetical protein